MDGATLAPHTSCNHLNSLIECLIQKIKKQTNKPKKWLLVNFWNSVVNSILLLFVILYPLHLNNSFYLKEEIQSLIQNSSMIY